MLVSNHDPAGFLVYRFKPLRHASNSIPGWSEAGPEPLTPSCIASYLLPNIHPRAESMSELTCRCEPTPVFEPPDYDDDDDNDDGEDGVTVADEVLISGSSDGADLNRNASTSASREIRKSRQESQDLPKAYPMPTPSLIVRPGQDDFRVAVITYKVQRENYVKDFIGFIAISELFKDAQERDRLTVAHRNSLRDTPKHVPHAEAATGVDTSADTGVDIDPDAVPAQGQKTSRRSALGHPMAGMGTKMVAVLGGKNFPFVGVLYLHEPVRLVHALSSDGCRSALGL